LSHGLVFTRFLSRFSKGLGWLRGFYDRTKRLYRTMTPSPAGMKKLGKAKKFDLEVEAEIEVNVYCYECGEDIEIEDLEVIKDGSVTVGVTKHKCKRR